MDGGKKFALLRRRSVGWSAITGNKTLSIPSDFIIIDRFLKKIGGPGNPCTYLERTENRVVERRKMKKSYVVVAQHICDRTLPQVSCYYTVMRILSCGGTRVFRRENV